jgi:hypothetical protein
MQQLNCWTRLFLHGQRRPKDNHCVSLCLLNFNTYTAGAVVWRLWSPTLGLGTSKQCASEGLHWTSYPFNVSGQRLRIHFPAETENC